MPRRPARLPAVLRGADGPELACATIGGSAGERVGLASVTRLLSGWTNPGALNRGIVEPDVSWQASLR